MRIIRFRHRGTAMVGFVRGDFVVAAESLGLPPDATVAHLIDEGLPSESDLDATSEQFPLADLDFLVPVAAHKILCAGVNFPTHRAESGRDAARPAFPTIFSRFPDSLVAHGDDLHKPRLSDEFDYECELAVVIGNRAWRVTPEQAMSHVFGYSCFNDGTVRDWQAHSGQWIPGKNFARSGSMGPWVVTADEFGTPGEQEIEARVNGQVRQHARLEEMIHSVAELVSYCSTFTPLEPGDVIAAGTTGGVGKYMTPQGYLRAGDVVEVEVGGVGVLRNTVADAP